jgi:hypothetical protein
MNGWLPLQRWQQQHQQTLDMTQAVLVPAGQQQQVAGPAAPVGPLQCSAAAAAASTAGECWDAVQAAGKIALSLLEAACGAGMLASDFAQTVAEQMRALGHDGSDSLRNIIDQIIVSGHFVLLVGRIRLVSLLKPSQQ